MLRIVFACFKLFLFSVLVLFVTLTQPLVLLVTRGRLSYVIPRFWHWSVCRIFGLVIDVRGDVYRDGQVMFMANHISYLDIPVLGNVLSASFVAKQDVEGWALFGFLSKLQQTVFISRDRAAAKDVQRQLDARLSKGQDLIIFPEGTSTDGRDVRDFKSSLFSLVVKSTVSDLRVQPVTVQVMEADGVPVRRDSDQALLDIYAWHIDMDTDLGVHLWRFAQTKGVRLTVTFHPPMRAAEYSDRKAMAQACQKSVKGGLV